MSDVPTHAAVRDAVFSIVAKQGKVEVSALTPASTLKDFGIASLTAIEILFEIEEKFDIDFPEQGADLDSGTLEQLVDAVAAAVAKKHAGAG
ncbi:MAG: hypothetical protein RLZZ393_911 [Pseudomonadota bacterium]|jgi:acyl carrier protein